MQSEEPAQAFNITARIRTRVLLVLVETPMLYPRSLRYHSQLILLNDVTSFRFFSSCYKISVTSCGYRLKDYSSWYSLSATSSGCIRQSTLNTTIAKYPICWISHCISTIRRLPPEKYSFNGQLKFG